MKIDRLMGILTILLQNEKITAPYLAERFEVSRRTIMRDVDTLCQAGIPIVTTRGSDGGISIMEGYKINKNVLTAKELQDLVAALKGMDSISQTSNFENLLMKLSPDSNAVVSLKDSVVIDLSSHYKASLSEKISLLKQAIEERRIIYFDYYYQKGEVQRKMEPYFIEFRWNAWYVFGWCCDKKDFRRFKLNRLWNLGLTQEGFSLRPVPQEKASGEDAFPDNNRIELLFDKSVRYRLIEEYGFYCYEEREDGLWVSMGYTNKEYILGWILGFGDKVEILGPLELRKEIKEMAEKILNQYKET